ELAAAAGAWFALGMVIIPMWPAASTLDPGSPAGTTTVLRQLEHLGFYTGLGVVIVFVAALALGPPTLVGGRDPRLAARPPPLGERSPPGAAAEPWPADATTGPISRSTTPGTGTTTRNTTTRGTTTSGTTTGRPGSLQTFGRWLVARR